MFFQAYTLAGRNFSMTSPDDICQVLYRELRLPQNGSKPSSAKDVLQKLTHLHELPQVILEWRKLNASVTKVVFPMSRAAHEHKGIVHTVLAIRNGKYSNLSLHCPFYL